MFPGTDLRGSRNVSVPLSVQFPMRGGQEGWDIKFLNEFEPGWAANPGHRRLIYLNASRMPPPLEGSLGKLLRGKLGVSF